MITRNVIRRFGLFFGANTGSSQETKVLNNTSSEIGESIDNITQDIPSIRDALTTSSSISNDTNLE